MQIKIIEASQDDALYGKFLVGRFEEEWRRAALLTGVSSLLKQEGWGPEHTLVLDLSRPGVGAIFAVKPNGYPKNDLERKRLTGIV